MGTACLPVPFLNLPLTKPGPCLQEVNVLQAEGLVALPLEHGGASLVEDGVGGSSSSSLPWHLSSIAHHQLQLLPLLVRSANLFC